MNKKCPQNMDFCYDEDYDGSTPLKNKRQEKFCLEYIKDFNQTQAAIRAGYKAGNAARRTAYRVMTHDYVHRRVEYLRQQVVDDTVVTVQYVIQGLKEIADDADCEPRSRVRSFELLGKTLAMFVDRKEVLEKPKRIIIRNESGEIAEELGPAE